MLLGQAANIRHNLEKELGKHRRLTRRLSFLQRKQLGLLKDPGSYGSGFPGAEIIPVSESLKTELEPVSIREFPSDYENMRELRAAEIMIISMIDKIKKKLLRLELIELRLRELLVSLNMVLQAYDKQWYIVRRSIYPLGIISVCFKYIRQILGGSHFSVKDLKGIAFLGDLAGNIIKMADPLLTADISL